MTAEQMGEAFGTIMAREIIPLAIGIWLGNKVFKSWKNKKTKTKDKKTKTIGDK